MIRAGDYRHQVRFESRSTTISESGQQLDVWTEFATRRAAIERTPGSEVFASAQREGRIPAVFKVRHLDGVTTAMRLVHVCCGGDVHDIKSPPVDANGRGEELLIVTEQREGETA